MTVNDLIARWRAEELPQRASTQAAYLSLLRRHIAPRWGAEPIEAVRPAAVEAWLRALELAPKTKANMRQLMHALYECARRWDLASENPIELVRQPARRTHQIPRLTPAQFRAMVRLAGPPHDAMLLLAAALGMRIGEIVGLQWADVDRQAGMVTVRRDVYQGRVDELKTRAAARELPLAAVVAQALERWSAITPRPGAAEFVFCQPSGRPLWPEALRKKVLRPLARAVGAPEIGWHALRHLCASAMHAGGVEVKAAQEILGHAQAATTMEWYTHSFDDRRRAAAEAAARMLA
jgi:integrase